MTSRNVSLAIWTVLICGAAMPSAQAAKSVSGSEVIPVRLVATSYNAGEIGKAMLVSQGDKTAVNLELSGVPDYTTKPIHIYAYIYDGSCGNRSSTPRYSLTDHVLAHSVIRPRAIGASQGPVRLGGTIPVAFQTIRATHYALSVRTSPADGNAEIFCGDNSG